MALTLCCTGHFSGGCPAAGTGGGSMDSDVDAGDAHDGQAGPDAGLCTQPSPARCTCLDGSPGERGCLEGTWSPCRCVGGRGPTEGPPPPECQPGEYAGSLDGTYRSDAFGPASGSVVTADLAGAGVDGTARLVFTLEEFDDRADQGFPTHTVENGCLEGEMRTPEGTRRFAALVRAWLDCHTGSLEGVLEGHYASDEGGSMTRAFHGPLWGTFDPARSSFMGAWEAQDQTPSSAESQGRGAWAVERVSAPGESSPLPSDCEELLERSGAGATGP